VLRIQIQDQGSGILCFFDPWIRDLGSRIGSGIGKKSGIRSDGKTRIIFLRAEKPFFLAKILKFFDADLGSNIRDGKNSDP
jgi:hypothetical protein